MDQTGPMKLLVVAHVIYKSHFGRKNGEGVGAADVDGASDLLALDF